MSRTAWVPLALSACLLVSTSAGAFVYIGDGVDGSWSIQGWQEALAGPWDFIRVDWNAGSRYFEAPAFRDYTGGPNLASEGWTQGWSNYDVGGHLIRATMSGSERNSQMNFGMWFTGTPGAIDFNYAVYDRSGGTCTWRQAQHFVYSGGWSIASLTQNQWDPGCSNPIPEPASALLIALGLVGVGAARRLRRL